MVCLLSAYVFFPCVVLFGVCFVLFFAFCSALFLLYFYFALLYFSIFVLLFCVLVNCSVLFLLLLGGFKSTRYQVKPSSQPNSSRDRDCHQYYSMSFCRSFRHPAHLPVNRSGTTVFHCPTHTSNGERFYSAQPPRGFFPDNIPPPSPHPTTNLLPLSVLNTGAPVSDNSHSHGTRSFVSSPSTRSWRKVMLSSGN